MDPTDHQGSADVRPGRSRGRGSARHRDGICVAVTGAAGPVGSRLVRRLAQHEDVGRVVALDEARSPDPAPEDAAPQDAAPEDHAADRTGAVTWRLVDVRDPALATRLGGVDVLVHTTLETAVDGDAAARRGRNLRAAESVLTCAAARGVRRVVLRSSAMVYGAWPDNPVPLEEDGPLRAVADLTPVGDLLELEALAARAPLSHPGLSVTVVRPATLVGAGEDSAVSRHFEAPRLLVVRDGEPAWQFCHVDDLVGALLLAALGSVQGVLTVGCEGWLSQREVEHLSGMRRLELPSALAFGTAERLHRLGVSPAPATDLQYVVHPWVVPSTRLRATGWRPAYDNATALGVLLQEVEGHHAVAARRLDRKDAALGAAGAAVAVVGTAALVRRARKRRRP